MNRKKTLSALVRIAILGAVSALLFYIELSMGLGLLADKSAAYWSKMVSDVKYMSIVWRTKERQ